MSNEQSGIGFDDSGPMSVIIPLIIILAVVVTMAPLITNGGQSAESVNETSTNGQLDTSHQPPPVNYSSDYVSTNDCGWFDVFVYDMNGADLVRVTFVPAFEYDGQVSWTVVNESTGGLQDHILGHIYAGSVTIRSRTTDIVDGDTVVITALKDGHEYVLETYTFNGTGCP